jgi:hypothetical protein
MGGVRIDTSDQRFKGAATTAHRAGLTQAQFTELLGHEARRVLAGASAKPAAASPRPAEPTEAEYRNMSFAQKMALGEAKRKAK